MSSHHIVRDEQEPALILHKIGKFPTTVLHSLLEWSPTVLSCETSIERFTSLGHKLDVVLIGFQNFTKWQEFLSDQHPIKIIATHGDDFLMTGLTLLQKDNHRAINIVTDEESVQEVLVFLSKWIHLLDLVIYTESKRYLLVKDSVFKKWLPVNSAIEVMSLQSPVIWTIEGAGISQSREIELRLLKQEEGELVIQSNKPPFLVIEEL
ncbi:MAG: hypothetical protein CMB80_20045 [Flammeovirgaceae bacterium]|nr:hypothetical protein [Flammeovirgaceae bacterium]MBR06561.1 hypothetical protein [Rickettsiales bacterium]HCX21113.1 hypothetical protein [Cytophagales bacterium]|tara:strand:+ start:10041 stop:10664 length:624 start_codon:yes stop_codon:yes gene_type:complete